MTVFPSHDFATPPGTAELRDRLRRFLDSALSDVAPATRPNCWSVSNPAFSEALADEGFVGMTLPAEYGGHGKSNHERYIVTEELLAAGAPVGAHWIADRQTGPLIARYGTDEQKRKYLPGMARGRLYSCIGLSEPNAGSDLASIRTSARRDGAGWRIDGQKVWTTNAHHAHLILAVVRTDPDSTRNAGLSQFLIDLDLPGVTIRPIINLAGQHDFNEVFFEDVHVDASALIGIEGNGWAQLTAELTLERSGPERYLSSHVLFEEFLARCGPDPDPLSASVIGELAAELWTLRQMSLATCEAMARGEDPMAAAVIVKDLGNSFEQKLPVAIQNCLEPDAALSDGSALSDMLALLLQVSPSFSLRGGTREILRGMIARDLGLR